MAQLTSALLRNQRSGREVFLVEMKWWDSSLGPAEVSQHMVRVFTRGHARGIFIGQPGFTEAALTMCKEGLQKTVFVLCELEEFVRLMNDRADLESMFKAKVRAAIVDKQPLLRAWMA
jgi:restriction system protein